MCDVKRVIYNNKPTEKFHVLASFSSLFLFYVPQLSCFGLVSVLDGFQLLYAVKTHCTLPPQHQTVDKAAS